MRPIPCARVRAGDRVVLMRTFSKIQGLGRAAHRLWPGLARRSPTCCSARASPSTPTHRPGRRDRGPGRSGAPAQDQGRDGRGPRACWKRPFTRRWADLRAILRELRPRARGRRRRGFQAPDEEGHHRAFHGQLSPAGIHSGQRRHAGTERPLPEPSCRRRWRVWSPSRRADLEALSTHECIRIGGGFHCLQDSSLCRRRRAHLPVFAPCSARKSRIPFRRPIPVQRRSPDPSRCPTRPRAPDPEPEPEPANRKSRRPCPSRRRFRYEFRDGGHSGPGPDRRFARAGPGGAQPGRSPGASTPAPRVRSTAIRSPASRTPTVSGNPSEAVRDADVVVLCVPIEAMAELVTECRDALKPDRARHRCGQRERQRGCRARAFARGPRALDRQSSHGRQRAKRLRSAARADLFENAAVIVTPTPQTSGRRRRTARGTILAALGGRTFVHPAPADHDLAVADISHVPHLLAAAGGRRRIRRSLPLAGGGFRDTTRIAAGSPELWTEILWANREALARITATPGQQLMKSSASFPVTTGRRQNPNCSNFWKMRRVSART